MSTNAPHVHFNAKKIKGANGVAEGDVLICTCVGNLVMKVSILGRDGCEKTTEHIE
jgi:hypothetical protein